jgi:hypothetical protein
LKGGCGPAFNSFIEQGGNWEWFSGQLADLLLRPVRTLSQQDMSNVLQHQQHVRPGKKPAGRIGTSEMSLASATYTEIGKSNV